MEQRTDKQAGAGLVMSSVNEVNNLFGAVGKPEMYFTTLNTN